MHCYFLNLTDLKKVKNTLNNNISPGVDSLSARVLNHISAWISPVLVYDLNLGMENRVSMSASVKSSHINSHYSQSWLKFWKKI